MSEVESGEPGRPETWFEVAKAVIPACHPARVEHSIVLANLHHQAGRFGASNGAPVVPNIILTRQF